MTAITLPEELAPTLAERALALLAEVTPVVRPSIRPDTQFARTPPPKCVVCHRPGKLGGHHAADGSIEWVHRRCHRKLHARGHLSARQWEHIRAAERHLIAAL